MLRCGTPTQRSAGRRPHGLIYFRLECSGRWRCIASSDAGHVCIKTVQGTRFSFVLKYKKC